MDGAEYLCEVRCREAKARLLEESSVKMTAQRERRDWQFWWAYVGQVGDKESEVGESVFSVSVDERLGRIVVL